MKKSLFVIALLFSLSGCGNKHGHDSTAEIWKVTDIIGVGITEYDKAAMAKCVGKTIQFASDSIKFNLCDRYVDETKVSGYQRQIVNVSSIPIFDSKRKDAVDAKLIGIKETRITKVTTDSDVVSFKEYWIDPQSGKLYMFQGGLFFICEQSK